MGTNHALRDGGLSHHAAMWSHKSPRTGSTFATPAAVDGDEYRTPQKLRYISKFARPIASTNTQPAR